MDGLVHRKFDVNNKITTPGKHGVRTTTSCTRSRKAIPDPHKFEHFLLEGSWRYLPAKTSSYLAFPWPQAKLFRKQLKKLWKLSLRTLRTMIGSYSVFSCPDPGVVNFWPTSHCVYQSSHSPTHRLHTSPLPQLLVQLLQPPWGSLQRIWVYDNKQTKMKALGCTWYYNISNMLYIMHLCIVHDHSEMYRRSESPVNTPSPCEKSLYVQCFGLGKVHKFYANWEKDPLAPNAVARTPSKATDLCGIRKYKVSRIY